MKKIISLLLFFISFAIHSQEVANSKEKSLNEYELSLQQLCKKLYNSKTDAEKTAYNQQLLLELEKALNHPNSFGFPFDSIKKDIHILDAEDGKFRIINWDLPKENGTIEYCGFIQSKHTLKEKKKKTNIIQLYPLIDKSLEIKNPDNYVSDNKKWLGMWYYRIITKKYKFKTYYTLLAWDGNDNYSQKKIIDVLTFDANGTPRFGADIFNYQKKFPKRVIFEYSATCNMSLKYSAKKDSIVFDHLAPTQPLLEGQFQYYCTDMSYDGFGFKKGKWNYGADINAINEKDEKDKLYNNPKKLKNDENTHESDLIIKIVKRKKEN